MPLPRIAEIEIAPEFTLIVTWKDGTTAAINMEGVIHGFAPFAPLRDPALFGQASIMGWGDGVEWPGGLDYSADSLAFVAEDQREMMPADLKAWQAAMGLSNAEAADWMGVALSTWKTYIQANKRVPRPVQIAARAAAAKPGVFQAHYKPRRAGRPRSIPA